MIKPKKIHIVLTELICAGYLFSQTPADWIEQEINQKQRALTLWRAQQARALLSNTSNYDVTYYRLHFRLDIPNQRLYGEALIEAHALQDSLTSIQLDFASNLQIEAVSGAVGNFRHENNVVYLDLNRMVLKGDTFRVAINYQGSPIGGGFQGFAFSTHGSSNAPIVSSLSEPYYASSWFPCKDRPNDKADSADIIITVPENLIAVSNGYLKLNVTNGDGTRTFWWSERYPIAVYLISIAVSNYVYWKDEYLALDQTLMPVEYWVYPEKESEARPYLSLTPQMIGYFARLWGEYPFVREKYGQAEFSWGGGMEHQTCTSLGSFSELLVCHELAHSWWGNMITCADWKNIWLNEGFARYAEALWEEGKGGFANLKVYMSSLNRPQYWQPGSVYIWDTTSVSAIFNRIVYDKGAWILHMLRKIVGEQKFKDILASYRQRFAYQSVVTSDFHRVCEEVSGQKLDWFFQEWVYGVGQPNYKVEWRKSQQGTNWLVDISLKQIQTTATIFKMPLDIQINCAGSDTIVTILDSLNVQQFQIILPSQPESLNLDPNGWVLKKVTYSQIDNELPLQPRTFAISAPYPNPFNSRAQFILSVPYQTDGRLSIVDLSGREIAVLRQGKFRPGSYQLNWEPQQCAAGLYFIVFQYGHEHLWHKIVYLK